MEADSWQQMLCVEAAAIDAPVVLAPDQRWKAAQTFECF
jgi:glucose-6-phosphate 1-epimerase